MPQRHKGTKAQKKLPQKAQKEAKGTKGFFLVFEKMPQSHKGTKAQRHKGTKKPQKAQKTQNNLQQSPTVETVGYG
jgi:hypothetical protein